MTPLDGGTAQVTVNPTDSGLHGPPPPEPAVGRGRHPVVAFAARRLLAGLATLLVISFLVFLLTDVLPGNTAEVVLGKQATPENVTALEGELGLDEPFVTRYARWAGGLATGDLGDSSIALATNEPDPSIVGKVRQPMRDSAILAGITVLLLVPLAISLGVLAAIKRGKLADYVISFTVLILAAFPEFVLGTFLIVVFFTELDLLPPVALIAPGETPFAAPDRLVLPVLTLLGIAVGFSARQLRAGMAESLEQDYVTMARLNGLRERRVITRYALRNALAPSVQAIAQTLQYLIGGIIVVEALFAYPGIGSSLVQAVSERDVTTVASIAVLLAAVYILINIIADLLVVFLVPKLRTAI